MKNPIIYLSLLALLISCGEESTGNEKENPETVKPEESTVQLPVGISPPAPGVNVPITTRQFMAEEGGSFVYETGSIVTFPESAVLHKDGTPVEGEFDVEYREFHDPIDIFFSGIPMNYDSAGTSYNFASAGMCEINAYQNGEKLMVNPEANPSVAMVSKDVDPVHNLYYYDEDQSKWLPQGKPVINDFKEAEDQPVSEFSLPVEPQKIDNQKHSFYISVDQLGSEFDGFDKMYFQIADEEKNYNPADAKIQWNAVDVKKSAKMKGKYIVNFSNQSTSRTYITDPVFSDKEYAKAMKMYNKVIAENLAMLEKEEANFAAWEAKQAVIIEQNRVVDSINALTAIRNAETLEYNDSMQVVIDSAIKENARIEEFRASMAVCETDFQKTRDFGVNNFGTWNCDNPIFISSNSIFTQLSFEHSDIKGQPHFAVIYKQYNSVFNYNLIAYRNLEETDEVVFFVKDTGLYYGVVKGLNKEETVQLDRFELAGQSYAEIKDKLLGY